MRIEYLEAALSDLDNITDYYFALFGIESAMKVYDRSARRWGSWMNILAPGCLAKIVS